MGVDQLTSKDEVRSLEQFERKKAAIQTIFTLAIIYAASVQIIVASGYSIDLGFALSPMVLLLIPALLLGGRNLLDQIGQATGWFRLKTI
jgi:hypothetical protein